jgi:hypothetical protein
MCTRDPFVNQGDAVHVIEVTANYDALTFGQLVGYDPFLRIKKQLYHWNLFYLNSRVLFLLCLRDDLLFCFACIFLVLEELQVI